MKVFISLFFALLFITFGVQYFSNGSASAAMEEGPKSRCSHVIQRPFIDLLDNTAGLYQTNTSMHYVETRLDDQILLALTATHDLKRIDGTLRIANKRVELLNCDAAFGNIQLLP